MNSANLIGYLEDLNDNNNKPWFDANRKRFDSLREQFLTLTDDIIGRIAEFDPDLERLTASDCVFRIYRDVRFSKDMTPYKTNFSAVFRPSKKSVGQGYYYSVDADGTLFIGGGVHMPDSPTLRKIRSAIAANGAAFDRMVTDKRVVDVFGPLEGDTLKTAPRDFPADHPFIHYLKRKSFTFSTSEQFTDIPDTALAAHVAERFELMAPLVKWMRAVTVE